MMMCKQALTHFVGPLDQIKRVLDSITFLRGPLRQLQLVVPGLYRLDGPRVQWRYRLISSKGQRQIWHRKHAVTTGRQFRLVQDLFVLNFALYIVVVAVHSTEVDWFPFVILLAFEIGRPACPADAT